MSAPSETELARLLRSMHPVLLDGEFVFATIASRQVPTTVRPVCRFEENEGTTLICRRADAAAAALPCTTPCRQITLTVHTSLEAVGFLAAVSTALARAGVPCNVVSAVHHDHLFVPALLADRAMAALQALQHAHTST